MAEIAVGAALIVVTKLLFFLRNERKLPKDVDNGVQNIYNILQEMQASLKDMDDIEGCEVRKNQVRQIREIAYESEDVLDEIMFHFSRNHHTHTLNETAHKVKNFPKDQINLHILSSCIKNILEKRKNLKFIPDIATKLPAKFKFDEQSSPTTSTVCVTPYIQGGDEMFVYDELRETIINQLIDEGEATDHPSPKTIMVVGSTGSGTSTLAKMVYNDRRVQRKYDCHAWIQVSRSYHIEDLLLNLFQQLCMKREVQNSLEGLSTRGHLKTYLANKRYVVVLDDIWKKEDWETISNAFPNGLAGSAIIITTRSDLDVTSPHRCHYLKGLSKETAFELFCKRAFYENEGICPDELKQWSYKIVERCDRQPLPIVTVASLLSKKQKIPAEWKKWHDSLGAEIVKNDKLSIITEVFLTTYNDLRCHLKSCFLFMGIFPPNYSVTREKLIRLWLAEGFVEPRDGKTLEEVAEDYLDDLIGRSLIQETKKNFDGRVRRCKILNLAHEIIIAYFEEKKLVTILSGSMTSSDINGFRRLSIHGTPTTNTSIDGDLSRVRSFFKFRNAKFNQEQLGSFKLLKVLDIQDSALTEFPEPIVELLLLRYLSLRNTNIASVPSSIKNLVHLQTLDLKHTQVRSLPDEIIELTELRHLLVYHYNCYHYVDFFTARGVEGFAGIGNLKDIQKLTLIKASISGRHSRKIFKKPQTSFIEELGKLVQLRNLGIVDLKMEDGENLCSSIQNMEMLSTLNVRSIEQEEYLDLHALDSRPPSLLQRLYLIGRLSKMPKWIGSLSSLVRIGLKWSTLRENPLDTLKDLPNLIELHMVDAFIGEELSFQLNKFPKLQILLIEDFSNLHTIEVEKSALSKLKKLIISKCQNLKMLPLGIEHVEQLRELLLYDMPNGLVEKLKSQSEERMLVDHIAVIHSFTTVYKNDGLRWDLLNLSR